MASTPTHRPHHSRRRRHHHRHSHRHRHHRHRHHHRHHHHPRRRRLLLHPRRHPRRRHSHRRPRRPLLRPEAPLSPAATARATAGARAPESAGWEGCEQPTCHPVCEHGTCTRHGERASCACFEGWQGVRCDEPSLPIELSSAWSVHGARMCLLEPVHARGRQLAALLRSRCMQRTWPMRARYDACRAHGQRHQPIGSA